jgi:putative oxidoreductase
MDRANDLVLLLGRLLMAALFLPSGFSKLLGFTGFAASLATKGLPYPEAWAAAAVAIEVLGPVALILGVFPRWTALLLIAFVVMASGTTHRYWEFTEAAARRAQEINFYKNVGIIAGLLFYFVSGPGAWSFARWRSTGTRQPQTA